MTQLVVERKQRLPTSTTRLENIGEHVIGSHTRMKRLREHVAGCKRAFKRQRTINDSKLTTLQRWTQDLLTVDDWEELWARDQATSPLGDFVALSNDNDEEESLVKSESDEEKVIKEESEEDFDWCKWSTLLHLSLRLDDAASFASCSLVLASLIPHPFSLFPFFLASHARLPPSVEARWQARTRL